MLMMMHRRVSEGGRLGECALVDKGGVSVLIVCS